MDDQYNTDIEMVMDFMKLAVLFDNKEINDSDKKNILSLQKSIIELLPVAQSDRMSAVYATITKIHKTQLRIFAMMPTPVTQQQQTLPQIIDLDQRFGRVESHGVPMSSSKQLYTLQKPVPQDKTNDHFIVLFFRSSCPACKAISNDWRRFKQESVNSNFTVLEYDGDDPANMTIFKHFGVELVPTVIKLRLDQQNYAEKLTSQPSYESIRRFAKF
ncbi:hypothetical protein YASMINEVIRUS_411 [Yasminevirus sp. GU-2018]|uniref:Thioredoxin domain-containing protein n=1 Tax=Yasminevirus sp. GU-2018 TaxID=2420051 RepID=A0A5K0U7K7_9VIRU|nr:hypothetical protein YASMINEVIRUS_411 [Yasminevirus sp. GU-2018]